MKYCEKWYIKWNGQSESIRETSYCIFTHRRIKHPDFRARSIIPIKKQLVGFCTVIYQFTGLSPPKTHGVIYSLAFLFLKNKASSKVLFWAKTTCESNDNAVNIFLCRTCFKTCIQNARKKRTVGCLLWKCTACTD